MAVYFGSKKVAGKCVTDISVVPLITSGTKIAEMNINGNPKDLYTPDLSSNLKIETTTQEGTVLASININGILNNIYGQRYDANTAKIVYSSNQNPSENLKSNTLYVCGNSIGGNKYSVISSMFIIDNIWEYNQYGSYLCNLTPGKYNIVAVGGGGNSEVFAGGGVFRTSSGGSGALISCTFTTNEDVLLSIIVAARTSKTYIYKNEIKVVEVDNGTNGVASITGGSKGVGGSIDKCFVDNSLFDDITKINGNNGTTNVNSASDGGNYAVSIYPYGGGRGGGWNSYTATSYNPQTGYVRITKVS